MSHLLIPFPSTSTYPAHSVSLPQPPKPQQQQRDVKESNASGLDFDIDSNFASSPLVVPRRHHTRRTNISTSTMESQNAVGLALDDHDKKDEPEVAEITKASVSFDSMEESDPATPTPATVLGKSATFEDRIPPLSPPPSPDRPSASESTSSSATIAASSSVAFPRMRSKRVRGQRFITGGADDSGSEEEDVPQGENVLRTPVTTPPVVSISSPSSPPATSPPDSQIQLSSHGLANHKPVQPGKCGTLRLNLDAIKRSYSEPKPLAPVPQTYSPANGPMIRKKSGEVVKSSMKPCRSLSGVGSGTATPYSASTPAQSGANTPLGSRSPSQESIFSLPSTPSKFVHFNHELEHVKIFTAEEKPAVISRTGSPTGSDDDDDTEDQRPMNRARALTFPHPRTGGAGYASSEDETKKPSGIKVSNSDVMITPATRTGPARGGFRTPPHGGPQEEWGLMAGRDLKLESLTLAGDGRTITGGVIVRNIAFSKWIAARFTVDWWQTTSEVTAKYSGDASPRCRCPKCPPPPADPSATSFPSPSASATCPNFVEPDPTIGHHEHFEFRPHLYDRFTFTVKLCDVPLSKIAEKTILMAIRYHVNGRELWDNNESQNYRIEFLAPSSRSSLFASELLPLANKPGTKIVKKKKTPEQRKEQFVNTGAAPTYISTGEKKPTQSSAAYRSGKPIRRERSASDDEVQELDALAKLRAKTKGTFSPVGSPNLPQPLGQPQRPASMLTRQPSSGHPRFATVPAASPPSSQKSGDSSSSGWTGDLRKQLEKVVQEEHQSKVRNWMNASRSVQDSDEDDEPVDYTQRPKLRPASSKRSPTAENAPQAFQTSSLKNRYDFSAAWKAPSVWSPSTEFSVPANKSFPQGPAATSNPFYGPGNHAAGSPFGVPASPAKRVFASTAGGHVYPGNTSPGTWPNVGGHSLLSPRNQTPLSPITTSSPVASSPTAAPGSVAKPTELASKSESSASPTSGGSPTDGTKPSMTPTPPRQFNRSAMPRGSPRDVDDILPRDGVLPSPKFSLDPERDYRPAGRKQGRERGSYFDLWAANNGQKAVPSIPSPSALAAGNPIVNRTASLTLETDSDSSSSSSSSDVTMDANQLANPIPERTPISTLAPIWSPPASSLASTPSVTSASSPSQSPSSPLELLPNLNSSETGKEMGSFLNSWCYFTGDRVNGDASSEADSIVHRRTQSASNLDQYFSTPFRSPPLPDFYGLDRHSDSGMAYPGTSGHGFDHMSSGGSTPTRTVTRTADDMAISPGKDAVTPRAGTPISNPLAALRA